MYFLFLILILGATLPNSMTFEKDDVQVVVSVNSHKYQWKITNLGSDPITSFRVACHNAYNHKAPDGWNIDFANDRFYAWTDDLRYAIHPRDTKSFSQRFSSMGAVLGEVPLELGYENSNSLVFEKVWGISPEPLSKLLVTTITLLAICLFHTILVSLREKSK